MRRLEISDASTMRGAGTARPHDRRASALLVVALMVCGGICSGPALAQKALVGGRLIDGFGGRPVENSVILIDGDRIEAVGQVGSLRVPSSYEVISTEGMSVLPGLWDMHVHLQIVGHSDYDHWDDATMNRWEKEVMPAAAMQLLHAGVTSGRELGAPLEPIVAVRNRINRGEIPGPTLYITGPFLQHRPYKENDPSRWGVYGVEDAREKVDRLADAGVDLIKLIDQDQMTMDEVHAIVDRAHERGLQVIAHSHRPEEIRRGILAGVDCFEHTGLNTMPAYPDDVFEMMKNAASTMYWTPTISPLLLYEYTRDNPERIDDPRWREGLPADLQEDVRQSLENLERLDYYQLMPRRAPTLKRKFEQLRESGIILLIGTDSGVPLNFHSDSTWRELDIWVNTFDVPVMEAIQAATYWPSVAQRVNEDVGTVSEGKKADIIAVRGDVLRHINLLGDVDLVMKNGEVVKQR